MNKDKYTVYKLVDAYSVLEKLISQLKDFNYDKEYNSASIRLEMTVYKVNPKSPDAISSHFSCLPTIIRKEPIDSSTVQLLIKIAKAELVRDIAKTLNVIHDYGFTVDHEILTMPELQGEAVVYLMKESLSVNAESLSVN